MFLKVIPANHGECPENIFKFIFLLSKGPLKLTITQELCKYFSLINRPKSSAWLVKNICQTLWRFQRLTIIPNESKNNLQET